MIDFSNQDKGAKMFRHTYSAMLSSVSNAVLLMKLSLQQPENNKNRFVASCPDINIPFIVSKEKLYRIVNT